MYFLNVFGYCHQRRHRSERFACKISVQTCYDHPYPPVRQRLGHFDYGIVEELGFIYSDHVHIARKQKHACRRVYGSRRYAVKIMGHDLVVRVSDVDGRFVDFHSLVCKLGTFEPSDQFFRLS